MPGSGYPRPRAQRAPIPRRSERDGALDRIQTARTAIARKSLWMKRGTVAVVAVVIGTGVLQEWQVLRLLAIPMAIAFWWLDASLTCADERLERLYDEVFQGNSEPPLMGDESGAASRAPEPRHALRRALLSGPGTGLHWMMAGVAVVFNIFV